MITVFDMVAAGTGHRSWCVADRAHCASVAMLMTILLALALTSGVFLLSPKRSESVTYLIVSVGVMFTSVVDPFIIGPADRVFTMGSGSC